MNLNTFPRKTEKIYYQQQYRKSITANITNINNQFIELDQTIAYPEGGGQDSDQGYIKLVKNSYIASFGFVKRVYGTRKEIDANIYVNVDGVILHQVSEDQVKYFSIGDAVEISIDPLRREKNSISHSASHLLYVAIKIVRPEMIANTIGCHIKEGQSRFDFYTDERTSPEQIKEIENLTNKLIFQNLPIETYPSKKHSDARYWKCAEHIIPCGGTHTDQTGKIGASVTIKRKSLGKGKERLICVLGDVSYSVDHYYS